MHEIKYTSSHFTIISVSGSVSQSRGIELTPKLTI